MPTAQALRAPLFRGSKTDTVNTSVRTVRPIRDIMRTAKNRDTANLFIPTEAYIADIFKTVCGTAKEPIALPQATIIPANSETTLYGEAEAISSQAGEYFQENFTTGRPCLNKKCDANFCVAFFGFVCVAFGLTQRRNPCGVTVLDFDFLERQVLEIVSEM